ncbi:MAG: hypothetical protein AMS14_06525 [Planctomycetes bacterium DG_20]|nr:MAG: hypothetical protein AMS14_06525 [Planctomycetes bacterium DG_20]
MTSMELRRRILRRLRRLSARRLRVADDFLAYLEECEDSPETRELLAIPGLKTGLERAERQADAGKTVPLSKVRRDV